MYVYVKIHIDVIYLYIEHHDTKHDVIWIPTGTRKNIERFTLYQNNLAMDDSPFKWQ